MVTRPTTAVPKLYGQPLNGGQVSSRKNFDAAPLTDREAPERREAAVGEAELPRRRSPVHAKRRRAATTASGRLRSGLSLTVCVVSSVCVRERSCRGLRFLLSSSSLSSSSSSSSYSSSDGWWQDSRCCRHRRKDQLDGAVGAPSGRRRWWWRGKVRTNHTVHSGWAFGVFHFFHDILIFFSKMFLIMWNFYRVFRRSVAFFFAGNCPPLARHPRPSICIHIESADRIPIERAESLY